MRHLRAKRRKALFVLLFMVILFLVPTLLWCETDENFSIIEEQEKLLFGEVQIISSGFFALQLRQSLNTAIKITGDQISSSNARSLEDLMSFFTPGVVEARRNGNGAAYLGIRGDKMGSTYKTLIIWDDVIVRNYGNAHNFYRTPLLGDVKEIEVLKGPGAIMYGAGAISGIINAIPKNGTDNAGLEGNIEYGSKEKSKKLELGYGKMFGFNQDIYIYAGSIAGPGMAFEKPITDQGRTADPYNRKAIEYYNPSNKISAYWRNKDFTLGMFYNDLYVSQDNMYEGLSTYKHNVWREARLGIAPIYNYEINSTDAVQVKGTATFADGGRMRIVDRENPNNARTVDDKRSSNGYSDSAVSGVYKTTRFNKQSLAAGLSYGQLRIKSGHFFMKNLTREYTNRGLRHEYSLFAEDIITISKKLLLSVGGHYDVGKITQLYSEDVKRDLTLPSSQSNLSSRIVMSYQFDGSSSGKLLFQQGFHYPDFNDVIKRSLDQETAASRGFNIGDLKPDKADNLEASFSKNFEELKLGLDAQVYYTVYKDLILNGSIEGVTNATTINGLGQFGAIGSELVFNWVPLKNTSAMLCYEFSRVAFMSEEMYRLSMVADETRHYWAAYPKHSVKGNVHSFFLDNKMDVVLASFLESGYDYTKFPLIGQYWGSSYAFSDLFRKPRIVVDLSVGYKLNNHAGLRLTAKNLFKNKIPGAPYLTEPFPYAGTQGTFSTLYYLELSYWM